jgi:hypothetical protein
VRRRTGTGEKPTSEERLWVALKPGVFGTGRVTFETLPPGMYSIGLDDDLDIAFEAREPKVDDLLRFPDSLAKTLLEEIDAFWRLGGTFSRHGFLHRRGYLLYGPHGSGKSSVVQQVIADILERAGVVFLCGAPEHLGRALAVFRRIEPTRPVVCVFEDIDAIVSSTARRTCWRCSTARRKSTRSSTSRPPTTRSTSTAASSRARAASTASSRSASRTSTRGGTTSPTSFRMRTPRRSSAGRARPTGFLWPRWPRR